MTQNQAAENLKGAIEALGGNPSWPHGGTPLLDATWNLAGSTRLVTQLILVLADYAAKDGDMAVGVRLEVRRLIKEITGSEFP